MKCEKCFEYKWDIKDLTVEIKSLKKYVVELEERIDDYKARHYTKTCQYCPRDMVGHFSECPFHKSSVKIQYVSDLEKVLFE